MADADKWMPIYIGDYMADTMHLTGPEHGAYLLLIMHYWRSGGPLPDDDKQLYTIARTERRSWDLNVGRTVRSFFCAEDGRLRHRRVDREMAKAAAVIEQRRAAGRASAQSRAEKGNAETGIPSLSATDVPADGQRNYNERPTAVADPLQRNGRPSPSPSESSLSKRPSPSDSPSQARGTAQPTLGLEPAEPTPADRRRQATTDFAVWYNAYPRKVARAAALKAYSKAMQSVDAGTLLSALQRYQFSPEKQYIPHPASWLNKEMWADEPAKPSDKPANPNEWIPTPMSGAL